MGKFEIREKHFYLDGERFQIISGAIHYFRVVPQYWRDRLEKLKAMGCNTVETYVAWNVHEPKKGEFVFSGMADVAAFVRLAQELGLYVILRPSPYICAEWEFGGLPAWLLAEDGMRLRVTYEPFLQHVREYYAVLLPILEPLQITRGGPVILMQVENEYGSYSNDREYVKALADLMRESGVDVPLVSSDGGRRECFLGSGVDGVYPTVNGGSHADERFQVLSQYTDGGPLMCMEFWDGWFDSWGSGEHKTGDLEVSAQNLDVLLEKGNLSFYMFHGGTNFGFMNGANYYDVLTPDVTSYDYGAPLSEDGQITEKYRRFQEIIGRHAPIPQVGFSTKIMRKSYGALPVNRKVGLFEALSDISEPVTCVYTKSMELLGQNYGYILYHSTLETEEELKSLRLWGANDRAQIFVNREKVLTLYDRELKTEHEVDASMKQGTSLDILMENMGRVNYGPYLERQRKGIDQGVQVNFHMHSGWTHYCLPLDNLEKLDFTKGCTDGEPAFYEFVLMVEEPADTFFDFTGFGKGCAFLNGFNLGRFWEIGPQKRLYIPAPLFKKGENQIILFETEGKAADYITLADEPLLG
ncbi:MAG: beta-galactosidase [Lachnospiraceae bacterium]|nr:beta-galactosidase [Lachnospiraceae bacterium]